jgi:hypothetical protein
LPKGHQTEYLGLFFWGFLWINQVCLLFLVFPKKFFFMKFRVSQQESQSSWQICQKGTLEKKEERD